ncbi:hypothetical protein Tco_0349498 [Tanacetum coccineum]
MFLNVDQLEKQLDNEEFQEIGSMAAFKMQTTEEKVDSSKALDASMVDTESSGTESKGQDTSSRSGNDAHANDADIIPIYDEELMAEVQTTTKINVFATGQQHTKQPEFNNEGEVDQNAEKCHDKCPLSAKLTDNQTTELSNQSLESENICLKKTVAQFQKDFLRMEAHCVNLELKYQTQALKEGQHGQFSKVKSIEAKIKHDIDDGSLGREILEKSLIKSSYRISMPELTSNSLTVLDEFVTFLSNWARNEGKESPKTDKRP